MHNPSVCVFCGSRPGNAPQYVHAAGRLGALLAARGWRLVYGAGDAGIMGAVAAAAQAAGGETLGVIPRHLLHREARSLAGAVVTETMHERKKVMYMNSDAVVVLPGGSGTLDEFFEIVTWRQLGLHDKPIFLLNEGGFWDPLVALVRHVIDEGFAGEDFAGLFTVCPSLAALESALDAALGPGAAA
jgi:uncharacterized protein (TIGR00730 family)